MHTSRHAPRMLSSSISYVWWPLRTGHIYENHWSSWIFSCWPSGLEQSTACSQYKDPSLFFVMFKNCWKQNFFNETPSQLMQLCGGLFKKCRCNTNSSQLNCMQCLCDWVKRRSISEWYIYIYQSSIIIVGCPGSIQSLFFCRMQSNQAQIYRSPDL